MQTNPRHVARGAGERVADSAHRRDATRWKLTPWIVTLFGFGCSACGGDVEPIQLEGDAAYSFFAAGHAYGSPRSKVHEGLYPPLLLGLETLCREQSLDFGVLLGDVVFRPSGESWDRVDAQLAKLDLPVHLVAGNHDLVPPDWPEELPGFLTRSDWEARYGSTYRSFRCGSDQFVILDPNIDGWRILGDQLAFLDAELEQAASARNLFVLMHQVLWFEMSVLPRRVSVNSRFGMRDGQDFEEEILPRFTALDIPVFVFSGDVGAVPQTEAFRVERVQNVTFIATGMGAGVADNFVLVEVSADGEVEFRSVPIGE